MPRVLLLCVFPLIILSVIADVKLQKFKAPDLLKYCKNVKCPPIEDPVCVKVKYKNAETSKKTIYIYMINKCELEYMRCHQDAEGVIVPKKHCEHKNSSNTAINKRVKRNALKVFKSKTVTVKKGSILRDLDGSDNLSGEAQKLNNDDLPAENNQDVQKLDNEGSPEENGLYEDNSPHSLEEQSECPTQCDIRKVMVCGKCQHGIYRTFMSPCHMRMFQCNNNDEKLELMSRYPCVLSAPYSHPVNEQVSEPNDVDDIQRFIYCREAYELGSKTIIDPRCSDFDMGKYFVEDQN